MREGRGEVGIGKKNLALAWKKNGDKGTECLGTADTGRDREGGVVEGGKKKGRGEGEGKRGEGA